MREGESRFVKFHWKPIKGVHSLVWDEAQKIAGKDPDFNRRDMCEAIERGDFPEWELGVQIVEEEDEHKFDFDLLDPTKIIPEELVPVQRVGKMVLNRNPDNFFAETEQVAFHPGHIVPGIDFTNDPLLQGRLFSYIDTQLKRVGPNFAEMPINRPLCPVHNNQRDAMARATINHKGASPIFPIRSADGCPRQSPDAEAFVSYPENWTAQRSAAQPELRRSFQPGDAVLEQHERLGEGSHRGGLLLRAEQGRNRSRARARHERDPGEHLPRPGRAGRGANGNRVAPPASRKPTPSAPTPSGPSTNASKLCSRAQHEQGADAIKGRKVAILVDDGVDETMLDAITSALEE